MRRIYLFVLQGAGWIVLLIVALNIEGVANLFGLSKLLPDHAREGLRMLKSALDFVREPAVFYVSLILLGASINSWFHAILLKLERRKWLPPTFFVAMRCKNVAHSLRWYRPLKYMEDIHGAIERANRWLSAHGIQEVKISDFTSEFERDRAARHFEALHGPLYNRDVLSARLLSKYIAENPRFLFPEPQLPQGTGSETPL